ncbi:hypothetical protein FB479_10847 [Brevibacillus sp. AG162]|uniref:hypothetical protein n=1 Tax=Brevibacillus sp. AG162 TaxID=2572910 RepID=UPI0011506145|nr:hypothetical protein [Brevibacillus sp. AG162]TQK53834.1 hypothetical protein FB479_10847 [Brevibacillus sp. AG162]
MLIQVNKISQDGVFLEPVLFDAEQVRQHDSRQISLGDNIITAQIPEGFFQPKWNGEQWVEGLTQQEIDTIKSKPIPPTELEIIGQQMVDKELQIMRLQTDNEVLGQQLAKKDLEIIQLQDDNHVLGQSIAGLERRLSLGGL